VVIGRRARHVSERTRSNMSLATRPSTDVSLRGPHRVQHRSANPFSGTGLASKGADQSTPLARDPPAFLVEKSAGPGAPVLWVNGQLKPGGQHIRHGGGSGGLLPPQVTWSHWNRAM